MTFLASVAGLDLYTQFLGIVNWFPILPAWLVHRSLSYTFWLLSPLPHVTYFSGSNVPVPVCGIITNLSCNRIPHFFPFGQGIHGNQVCFHEATRKAGLLPGDIHIKEIVAIEYTFCWYFLGVNNIKREQLGSLSSQLYTPSQNHASRSKISFKLASQVWWHKSIDPLSQLSFFYPLPLRRGGGSSVNHSSLIEFINYWLTWNFACT